MIDFELKNCCCGAVRSYKCISCFVAFKFIEVYSHLVKYIFKISDSVKTFTNK